MSTVTPKTITAAPMCSPNYEILRKTDSNPGPKYLKSSDLQEDGAVVLAPARVLGWEGVLHAPTSGAM